MNTDLPQDAAELAQKLTLFLAPLLPKLLDQTLIGAGREAGKKTLDQSPAWGQRLWEKLRPKVEAKEAAREAAEDVAAHPQDNEAQVVLRRQIEKLLKADEALGTQVAALCRQAAGEGIAALAFGAGSIAVSGSVTNSELITGQGNKVTKIVHHHHALAAPEPKDPLPDYFRWLRNDCAPLRLQAIYQGAPRPGTQALGLTSVYVDLNTDKRIPAKTTLAEALAKEQGLGKPLEGKETMETEVKTRLVAVLEALAQHPKMVLLGRPGSGKSTLTAFLALSLAEARLGEARLEERLSGQWSRAGLLHQEDREDQRSPSHPWPHGPLLPIRVVLRKFAASLPAGSVRGCARHVWDFIRQDLVNSSLVADTADALQDVAKDKGVLFLFDGLDEARDPNTRARVLEAVADFVDHASPKYRFLLTSRPYAWEETAPALARQPDPLALDEMFVPYTLADFQPGQIESFIQRWYPAVQERGWVTPADATAKTQELLAAVKREDLQALARNPLLLNLMATLHSSRAKLPEDRADLYDEVVKLLLERWNETVGADRGLLLELNIPSLKLEDIRLEIQRLAYDAHKLHVGREGAADVAEGDLEAALCPLLQNDRNKAAVVIEYIEKRAGLLLGQGPRGIQRQFTFPHRTFQEFLAGCHLERSPEFYDLVQQLAREHPAHWREVLTFAARRATASRGVPAADRLVHRRSVEDWRRIAQPSAPDWRCALIAGEQLLEIGLAAVNSRPEHSAVRECVAGWLAALLSAPVEAGGLPAKERARAGVILGRLGDPRKGVAPTSPDELADMEFCFVPPGAFWMGGGKEARRADCPKPGFWISRFPVTVAQYHLFVEGGGYRREDFWPEAAKAGYWKAGHFKGRFDDHFAEGPREFGPPFNVPNHPVVGVSWYQALAFCRWLTERWRDRLPKGGEIKLPSEAEWEVAARGGLRVPAPACVKRFSEGLHVPGNLATADNEYPNAAYPWGNEFSPERANTAETGIGATSAVGAFIGGHSPVGAEELSGNVWEWTRSLSGGGEDLAAGSDQGRVLRGGAWFSSFDLARCSGRFRFRARSRYWLIGFRVVAPPFDSGG